MLIDSGPDVVRLRRVLRDLVALSAIPAAALRSKSREEPRYRRFWNGCSSTSPRAVVWRTEESFEPSAMAQKEVTALSFPSVSMRKVVLLRRRVIAPAFPTRPISCCSPLQPITPRRHFGWHASSTVTGEPRERYALVRNSFAKRVTNLRRR